MIRKQLARSLRTGNPPLHLPAGQPEAQAMPDNVVIECGWGRLLPGQTWREPALLATELLQERPGQRDIAFYVEKPHVVVAAAPQQLFVDPSEAFRLSLGGYRSARQTRRGFTLRRLRTRADVAAINVLYRSRGMVPVDTQRVWRERASRAITYAMAEDRTSGEIIGVAMGLDHVEAFADAQHGASLWALAVAPQAAHPGVGESLVRYLAEHYQARGRISLDVSVMHDNSQAIALYEKLGFQRIAAFAVKRRNAINEPLFTGPENGAQDLNPYARLIVTEARRRGILVEVLDAENGYFRLTLGGRSIVCRESLSELTSAIAMSRCQDKRVTLKLLREAGLHVPAQADATDAEANERFLAEHGVVVVKPVEGEQGKGISVDLRSPDEVAAAIERAHHFCDRVILEQYCEGEDLRIVVIDFRVVAAAVRRPPVVVGDGRSTVLELIEKQSRRRQAATGGESSIPVDEETERCLRMQGHGLEDVLAQDVQVRVRNTANLHTGGTIHDVTDELHPALRDAAEAAARALDIPVTGLDFLVPAVDRGDYVIIEANERPGLANHEPQPTAERFIDLLFPRTRAA
ncbi:N-acetylglutaminylglutamine synthetase [Aromatoleum buckelii]|uniref:N-acetylglutaminylglutamine synthetase n=1 Tax=Aromatoleum buckelii TaxID=200254 RepID=A0ABX1N2U5_9RHOO|nr:N-acetylglutaminylglutamine synthetase [Aromatoleum buckelii]MCK0511341.1 N-acetylglutaminylglutamine synthetase [Aromatoleum buckelii]